MNKDVIYVEPEDDITDIITKIENAKEKIVALVPPKKASVFRSIVNIKLINKAGISASKKVVLVTTDASVIKLAAVAKLPVTKSLHSAPSVPELDTKEETTTSEELVQKKDGDVESEEESEEKPEESADEDSEKEEEKEEKTEESDKKSGDDSKEKDKDKAEKKAKKEKGASKNWFVQHRVLIISGVSAFLVLLLLGVWMFAIAPAVDITVSIRTTQSNFSENATFVAKLQDEVAAEGKFYIEEKKQENTVEKEFEATGQKNIGEKAKGQVIVIASFRSSGSASVEKGDTFTQNEHTFIADEGVVLSWDGVNANGCDNKNSSATEFLRDGCIVSKTVDVTAEKPGAEYNIEAAPANWRSSTGFGVYSSAAMTGGTDVMITVVQQSDIDKALNEIGSNNNDQVNREKLYDSVNKDNAIIIESSYSHSTGDPVSSPALGEEVKDGKKAKLSVTTTNSVYIIDKTKVEEFIATKAKLNESFKIYEINEPYVDNFVKNGDTYTGKLKAVYVSGPKVTENDIVEMAKGKGLGSAQHELSSIDGVSKITIDPSYPWVNSVPNDPERITVNIKVDNQEK